MNGGGVMPQTRSAWEDSPGWPGTRLNRPDIEARISKYNQFHAGTRLQVKSQAPDDDSLLIEGPLRIRWDVKSNISFQKLDSTVEQKVEKTTRDWRRSYCDGNGLDESLLQTLEGGGPLKRSEEVEDIMSSLSIDEPDSSSSPRVPLIPQSALSPPSPASPSENGEERWRYNTISHGGGTAVMRRRKKPRKVRRRLSMINGHLYDLDTSNFTPTDGSATTVRVTSRDNAPSVIRLLLHKFKVQNNPDEFCLCSVKKTGETRVLQESDYPLMERVLMGPLEEEAKIYLRDKSMVKDISNEVAQFMNLPEQMLNNFLQKLDDDERGERHRIIVRYQRLRKDIEERLKEIETPSYGID